MKKILLSAGMLFLTLATQAQECTAVATLNENFDGFTEATGFPQNCWSKIVTGTRVYLTPVETNLSATFYSFFSPNQDAYLITPQLSTIDGKHQLSFTTNLSAGSATGGIITLQVGTVATADDASTFVAIGDPITVNSTTPNTVAPIVIEAAATQKYIAFKFSGSVNHTAGIVDNVVYEEVPVTTPVCEAVATLDENFDAFDATAGFTQNCWNKIVSTNDPRTNSMVYLKKTEANVEAIYYSNTGITETPLLITPEISNLDGKHALTFDAYKTIPGNVTIQLGTLSDVTDASTFVAVGNPINLVAASTTAGENTYSNIVFPSSVTQKYVAFKFSTDTEHSSARLDNIKWTTATTAGVNDFAKNKFSIFPNPSSTKNVTIAYTGTDKANVTVYSVTGAKVFETVINGTNANLNLSSLSSGMYIVKLTAGNATATQKLVIQ